MMQDTVQTDSKDCLVAPVGYHTWNTSETKRQSIEVFLAVLFHPRLVPRVDKSGVVEPGNETILSPPRHAWSPKEYHCARKPTDNLATCDTTLMWYNTKLEMCLLESSEITEIAVEESLTLCQDLALVRCTELLHWFLNQYH